MLQENKLVFVISLPRSGSTMMQHILGAHSEMIATAEPWILFPAGLSLRKDAINAVYDHEICRIGLIDFLSQLKNKEQEYYNGVNKMASHLYETFLKEKNKTIFIDKTSRYYLMLPELFKIFPQAKFIFLVRNPMATFNSFINTMVDKNLSQLGNIEAIRNDLLLGYKLINEGYNQHKNNSILVRYEDVILNPEKEIEKLCKYIGVEFELEMLNYKSKTGVLQGKLVDPKSIHKHDKPVAEYVDKWKLSLKTKQEKILAKGFIEHVGKTTIKSLGYSYEDLMAFFEGVHLNDRSLKHIQWNDLMTAPNKKTKLQKDKMIFSEKLQKAKYKSLIKFLILHPIFSLRFLISFFK